MIFKITFENISGARFTVKQIAKDKYEAIALAKENYVFQSTKMRKNVFPIVYEVVPDSML